MRAGLMRHRIRIEEPSATLDGTLGVPGPTPYTVVAVTWASIDPVTGSERFVGQQLLAQCTHTVRMRYLSGVSPRQRIVTESGSRVFHIVAVLDYRERRRELILTVVEEVPARG